MVPLGRVMFSGLVGVMTLGPLLDRVQRCVGYVSHRNGAQEAGKNQE